ncbi:hypothetical protein Smp_136070 [Schistosoma mansoni]|uniref:hypothetical protein n=1 Tax=Schistosoma mansoni TaxID=6183 RepID=UPI00022DCA4B|nr:hypothetical protein Smp_136070 [Schistosoma mansoni]|eukprot:XP_018654931.1 hypothetical protein Smp_136070 [Schistosoma mansoni]
MKKCKVIDFYFIFYALYINYIQIILCDQVSNIDPTNHKSDKLTSNLINITKHNAHSNKIEETIDNSIPSVGLQAAVISSAGIIGDGVVPSNNRNDGEEMNIDHNVDNKQLIVRFKSYRKIIPKKESVK